MFYLLLFLEDFLVILDLLAGGFGAVFFLGAGTGLTPGLVLEALPDLGAGTGNHLPLTNLPRPGGYGVGGKFGGPFRGVVCATANELIVSLGEAALLV